MSYNTISPKDSPIIVEPVQELSDTGKENEQMCEEQANEHSIRVADLKDYREFTVKDITDIIAEQSRKKSPKEVIFELYREKYGYFVPTVTGANVTREPRKFARLQREGKAAEKKYQTTIFTQLVDDVCKE